MYVLGKDVRGDIEFGNMVDMLRFISVRLCDGGKNVGIYEVNFIGSWY